MPDNKGNLFLFEAIELRDEYDRQIKIIENLLGIRDSERSGMRFYSDNDIEGKEPVEGFCPKDFTEKLKKMQSKRIKLNHAIQMANFETEIDYNGEKISIAEALEVRKNLLANNKTVAGRVVDSAYKRITHKEERDIVHEPKHSFSKSYENFQDNLKELRGLINQIHMANHQSVVKFKDE
ncbi:hypothetical protein [Candidatus Electrothrix sp.]|uniref:hypothetical protein n=1 Tax=Candidatus Electrothrix sp. TaxID=2170559 RepID=UPI004055B02C